MEQQFTINQAVQLAADRLNSGRLDEARGIAQAILAAKPEQISALSILGASDYRQGRLAEAIQGFRRVHEILQANTGTTPEQLAQAAHNLASALDEHGELASAEAAYRDALLHTPDALATLHQLTVLLREQGRLDEADDLIKHALTLDPNNAETLYHAGCLSQMRGFSDNAVSLFRKALQRAPDYAEVHVNLGMTLLTQGDYQQGLPEYEWRWRARSVKDAAPRLPGVPWDGQALEKRHLFVGCEQGMGDNIQFCRYLALARERNPECAITFWCPTPLLRWLQPFAKRWRISLLPRDSAQPPADYTADSHVLVMSMPLVMGTTAATIPRPPAGYLALPTEVLPAWRARTNALPPGLRVGLCWRGAQGFRLKLRRDVSLELLIPLAGIPDIQWVSLQKGASNEPHPAAWKRKLLDWTDELDDFTDTAALVASLDLVICVDTSIAHVAGAVGTPVWLLNRFDTCWRWGKEGETTPWYPGMHIFRQSEFGDWGGCLRRVKVELAALV